MVPWKWVGTLCACPILIALLVACPLISHLVRHGSLFVDDPSSATWLEDFPRIHGIDLLAQPQCLKYLRTKPSKRTLYHACGKSASGREVWLNLQVPFLLTDAFKQWKGRWEKALTFFASLPSAKDVDLDLHERPIEQHSIVTEVTTLANFAKGLQKWPHDEMPARALYWSEGNLVRLEVDDGKASAECDFLTKHDPRGWRKERDKESCKSIVEFLFQDFGWVSPILGTDVKEVEIQLWAGPRGSRTGLHADIEPYNLLVVMTGRKRVTIWPPSLRRYMNVSGRFDESASISSVDVFHPRVDELFPGFASVRHLNFTFEMNAGDVVHIPAGWWHVVENLETTLAITLHVWAWSWSEYLKWAPHALLTTLHEYGLYRHGFCTCHPARTLMKKSYYLELGRVGNSTCQGQGEGGECKASIDQASPLSQSLTQLDDVSAGFVTDSSAPPFTGSPRLREDWKLLMSTRSAFQSVAVWHEKREDNRFLLLNGDIQLTLRGEYVYHEMLSYVPLAAALCAPETVVPKESQEPRKINVFVFGAGDGGIAQRLLWHPQVARVVQVEIDEVVVNASRRYFRELQPTPEEAGEVGGGPVRHTLLIGDAVDFARRAAEGKHAGTFDLVILDTTDVLIDPGEGKVDVHELFTPALYSNLYALLRPGGVLAQNSLSLTDGEQSIRWLRDTINGAFEQVYPFWFATPDFTSPFFCMLALKAWATPDPQPHKSGCARQLLQQELGGRRLKYYSAAIHASSFILPAVLADLAIPGTNS